MDLLIFTILAFLIQCLDTNGSLLSANLPDNAFISIWNAPSAVCDDKYGINLNLSYFDIIANTGDTFEGDEIVIFYKNKLGLYPWIDEDGTWINGGLPQLADLETHLNQVRDDLSDVIPSDNFTGLAVIDWEEWRPIFARNGYNKKQKSYIRASENIVRNEHPDWPEEHIRNEATKQFENSARLFMQTTLELCQRLRPRGYWGFYGFPQCYNYHLGEKTCANDTIVFNNRLSWLFNTSTSILPSIYMQEDFGTHEDRYLRAYGDLHEAVRVTQNYGGSSMPLIAYTRYSYGDTRQLYDKIDLNSSIRQAANAGFTGIALWDSSESFSNREDCENVRDYIDTTLGPFVKHVTTYMQNCSRMSCHGHGRCVSETWAQTIARIRGSHYTIPSQHRIVQKFKWLIGFILQYFGNIFMTFKWTEVLDDEMFTCSCFKGFSGQHCENS